MAAAAPKAKPVRQRRSRQPRNPQLSVARRNERERNRVKMVNNGFALLREHLPADELEACLEAGSSCSPEPSGPQHKCASLCSPAKGKKFSKVETLRAAIRRIRLLEELIRSTEPELEGSFLRAAAPGSPASFGCAGPPPPPPRPQLPAAYELLLEPSSSAGSAGPATPPFSGSPAGRQLPPGPQEQRTQLWVQQHQNSFLLGQHDQQQQQQPAEQPQPQCLAEQPAPSQTGWYSPAASLQESQPESNKWSANGYLVQSDAELELQRQHQRAFSPHHHHLQHQQHQQHQLLLQQPQLESPNWLGSNASASTPAECAGSPLSSPMSQPAHQHQQAQHAHFTHQPVATHQQLLASQHQISLYSQ